MPRSDLAHDAADLLSIAKTTGPRSLNQLVALAARQVAACAGATAALWRSGEPVVYAASHPDLATLVEVELGCGRGPAIDALAALADLASRPVSDVGAFADQLLASTASDTDDDTCLVAVQLRLRFPGAWLLPGTWLPGAEATTWPARAPRARAAGTARTLPRSPG